MNSDFWNPAEVIDKSQAIFVLGDEVPGSFRMYSATRSGQDGRLLGIARRFEVEQVIDGPDLARKPITIFQEASGLHDHEEIADGQLIVFLRKMTDAEIEKINLLHELEEKLQSPAWALAVGPRSQWMSVVKLPVTKVTPGVSKTRPRGAAAQQIIELAKIRPEKSALITYIRGLVQLRKQNTGVVVPKELDVLQKKVLRSP